MLRSIICSCKLTSEIIARKHFITTVSAIWNASGFWRRQTTYQTTAYRLTASHSYQTQTWTGIHSPPTCGQFSPCVFPGPGQPIPGMKTGQSRRPPRGPGGPSRWLYRWVKSAALSHQPTPQHPTQPSHCEPAISHICMLHANNNVNSITRVLLSNNSLLYNYLNQTYGM